MWRITWGALGVRHFSTRKLDIAWSVCSIIMKIEPRREISFSGGRRLRGPIGDRGLMERSSNLGALGICDATTRGTNRSTSLDPSGFVTSQANARHPTSASMQILDTDRSLVTALLEYPGLLQLKWMQAHDSAVPEATFTGFSADIFCARFGHQSTRDDRDYAFSNQDRGK
jgi:hypothetical protein